MGPEEVVPVAVEGRPWGVVSLREEREEKGGIPEVKVLELGKGQQGGCLFFFGFCCLVYLPFYAIKRKDRKLTMMTFTPNIPSWV